MADITTSLQALAQQLSPVLIQAGATAASNIGSRCNSQLQAIGSNTVHESITSVADSMPFMLRAMILTREEMLHPRPTSQLPTWARPITQPILNPIINGVRREAKRRADIVAPRALTGISVIILTLFSIGYIIGVKTAKK